MMIMIWRSLLTPFNSANKTLVPIRCRVVKDISKFDGAWTMWESKCIQQAIFSDILIHSLVHLLIYSSPCLSTVAGLMDEIALKVYDALAYHVTQANFNQRVRAVSYWSLQKTLAPALSSIWWSLCFCLYFLSE